MMQVSLWQKAVILGLCLFGFVMAMPNAFYTRVEAHNDALTEIEAKGETPERAAARDGWPSFLPSSLVNLGLDLRGGAHLLAEVHVEDVYKTRMDSLWNSARDALRDERATVGNLRKLEVRGAELRFSIEKPEGMEKALEVVRALGQPVISLSGVTSSDIEVSGSGAVVTVRLTEAEMAASDDRTVAQSLEIIRNRVDAVGTREPTIQRIGKNRILIDVPGVDSAEELIKLIGKTAKLTFHQVVAPTSDGNAVPGSGNLLLPAKEGEGAFYIVNEIPVLSGEDLIDARPDFDQNGKPAVAFRFNTAGAIAFGTYTSDHIGQLFAIVLDGEVISAPQIINAITQGSGIITGAGSIEESTNLAILLRAGSLPAELTWEEQRTIGPDLGKDSIEAGKRAAVVGMLAVVAYMIASYGVFGLIANIALAINIVLLFAMLTAIGATLTLPGIAGIVLTMGMSVDANVLIFERIREELRQGKRVVQAIETGFEKAFSAIVDSNLTTIITAIIMFWIGSGPVRGFAITLGLGIITSMFTAVYVTRLLITFWINWKRPTKITV